MNKVSLDKKEKRILGGPYPGKVVAGDEKRHSWPLRTGREPTTEEFAESVKKLTKEDRRLLLERAGIIDKDGNLTEQYR